MHSLRGGQVRCCCTTPVLTYLPLLTCITWPRASAHGEQTTCLASQRCTGLETMGVGATQHKSCLATCLQVRRTNKQVQQPHNVEGHVLMLPPLYPHPLDNTGIVVAVMLIPQVWPSAATANPVPSPPTSCHSLTDPPLSSPVVFGCHSFPLQGMAYSQLAGLPPVYGLYASIFSLLIYPFFSTAPQLAVGPVAMVGDWLQLCHVTKCMSWLTVSTHRTDPAHTTHTLQVSLLSNAAVSELGIVPETDRFVQVSIILAFMTGVIQVILGFLKAGFLVNFLSHPVLKGFTVAAAFIIGSSQLGKLLGFKLVRSK